MPTVRAGLASILVVACACPAARRPEPPADGPRLVVLLVVDQLPSWSFTERAPRMRHGFARLIQQGIFWPEAAYPYAATSTAPGHAALSTGAPPAVTGILANTWFDRERGAQRESVESRAHPLLVIPGSAGAPDPADGAAPDRLRVDGIGDVLRRERPGAKAVGVALKDRSAILAVGRTPTISIWYDSSQIAFTTSRWFAPEAPGWLVALAAEHPIAPRFGEPWTLSDEALVRELAAGPDDGPGEANVDGLGITFPHRLDAGERPARAVVGTPLGNQIVVEAALAAVDGEALGRDEIPDFLAVSFSAADYVGHYWGQESWEEVDMLLRLDAQIGELLAGLDERIGAGSYAVVLTSDHGAARTVERSLAQGRRARRVDPAEVERAAEEAAAAIAGTGDWIAAGRDPAIYLSAAARALPADLRERVIDAVTGAVAALDGVGYAFRSDRACGAEGELAALVCRAIDLERSGEIYFGPAEGSIVMRPPFEATAHGSANPEDRVVPLILVAPGVAPRRDDAQVSMLRVAPTLAALLGVAPPPAAAEPPLAALRR